MVFQPTQFGKYYLTRRIAVGGMAEIFQAKLFGVGGFEKPMVVKQILPQYARNAEFINMFIDEAKIAVTLTHGNIVPVYELGRIGDTYFIAMEYVPGRDLAEILEKARAKGNPLSPEHAAYIAIEICKGLDYAHRRTNDNGQALGVVHRDISPPNVLISMEGQVKITDFGIAKAVHKLGTTESGVVKGTFGYMSPEQVRGLPVDHRTDIFSTGILLHEMLTGRRLFVGKNDLEAIERVKEAQIPATSAINPNVPGAVDPIVFKALAKDMNDRFATANEFQLALSRFLFTSGTGATAATLSGYMAELFGDERPTPADEEEILFSAFNGEQDTRTDGPRGAQPRKSPVDNATHSYAVRPELEEATSVMEHPAPQLMAELTPSIPTAPRATGIQRGRKSTASDAGAGRGKHLDRTRALPALAELKTDEQPFAPFHADGSPKMPQVPELRFPPQERPEGSRPATLPSIPSMLKGKGGSLDHSSLEPEEEFPSADELATLADQLEEATTEPRVVATDVPKPPKLVPPTAKQPDPPAEVPGDAEQDEPSLADLAATDPSATPDLLRDLRPLPFVEQESGSQDDIETAAGVQDLNATASSLQSSPHVHRVSRQQQSRISGVLSGTLRMFVEGLDDEQEEARDPSAAFEALGKSYPGFSDSSAALKVPRTIKPTTLGWILISVVVVAAALFVVYKKTNLFTGGRSTDEAAGTLKPEDIKPEDEKKERLGNIRVSAAPAGASFLLFAGETPVRLELDRGRPTVVKVERDGFRPVYRTVKPEDFNNGKAEVQLTLDPVGSGATEEVPTLESVGGASGQRGTLSLKTDPPKAMVWQLVGQNVLELSQVKLSKSYYFKVVLAGHRPAFVRVSDVDFQGTDTYTTEVKLEPEQAASDGAAVAPDAAPTAPDAASKEPATSPKRPATSPRSKATPRRRPPRRRPPRRRPPKTKATPRPKTKTKTKTKGGKISVPSWAQ